MSWIRIKHGNVLESRLKPHRHVLPCLLQQSTATQPTMNQWTMILSPATDLWWSDHPFSKRSLTFANEGNKLQSRLQVLSVNKRIINRSIIWIIHVRALLCLINRFQQLPSPYFSVSDAKNHPPHRPIRASTPGTINHVFGRTCGKKYPPALGGGPTGKVFSKGRKRAKFFPKAKCIYILLCYSAMPSIFHTSMFNKSQIRGI